MGLSLDVEAQKGKKRRKNQIAAPVVDRSEWADFVSSLDMSENMKFDGLNVNEYLPSILDAYRLDHPETEPKIQAMKGKRSGQANLNGLTDQDKMHMMKYLQLKYTILFLQQNKFIGKYCFYGCWCLPAGAGFEKQGFGSPVDNIDKSCHEFTTCYMCLYNPAPFQGENCNEMQAIQDRYQIQGSAHPTTGQITLFCMDPQGTCLRSRCECDKGLSEKLQIYEAEWNMQNHHKWGNPPFVPQNSCGSKLATPQLEAGSAGYVAGTFAGSAPTSGKTQGFDKESVNKLASILQMVKEAESERNPGGGLTITIQKGLGGGRPVSQVVSAPIYGAISGCCGRSPNVHYYREGQRCCQDGEIVDAQAPCSMDFM